jgi:hypothetical protein
MKLDLTNYKNYESGRDHAKQDAQDADFDLLEAIASFDADPADSPFQQGYLRGLKEEAQHA